MRARDLSVDNLAALLRLYFDRHRLGCRIDRRSNINEYSGESGGNHWKNSFGAAVVIPLIASATEWTITQPIAVLQLDGADKSLYLAGGLKWGAASCPNATYAKIPTSVQGHKEILAISLAAKAAVTPVRLFGTCGENNYFDVTFISLE